MRVPRPSPSLLVASAALVTAVAGVGVAAIPSGAGTITGCYRTANGALRVVDTAHTPACAAGERRLTWNQQGVAGPQGMPGQKGDPGPAGPSSTGGIPTGATMRGVYAVTATDSSATAGENFVMTAINYGGELSSEPRPVVVAAGQNPKPAECPGTIYQPEAAPGVLCIYRAFENALQDPIVFRLSQADRPDDTTQSGGAAGRSGAVLLFRQTGTDPFKIARGSWAVTAP